MAIDTHCSAIKSVAQNTQRQINTRDTLATLGYCFIYWYMKSNLYAFVDSFVSLIICSVVSVLGRILQFVSIAFCVSVSLSLSRVAPMKNEKIFHSHYSQIFPTLLRYLASRCCQRRHRHCRLCRHRIHSTIFRSVEANDNGINRAEEMKIKSWAT